MMDKLDVPKVEGADLSPFKEEIFVDANDVAATAKLRINFRWDTECEWLHVLRVYGHKKKLTKEEVDEQVQITIQKLCEKLLWIYKANHGLLDGANGTVRFKK